MAFALQHKCHVANRYEIPLCGTLDIRHNDHVALWADGRGMSIKSLVAHSNFNAFALVGFFSCLAASPVSALVIDATFESSITSDPNAASIEAQINSAIQTIDGLYGTFITVKVSIGTNLSGHSSDVAAFTSDPLVPVPYASYVNQLTAIANADPNNTVLATALQHINDGNGAVQYGGTNKQVAITYANAQALGLSPVHYAADNTTLLPGPPQYDATIQFKPTYFSADATPSGALQLIGVSIAEHELNHILGAADFNIRSWRRFSSSIQWSHRSVSLSGGNHPSRPGGHLFFH